MHLALVNLAQGSIRSLGLKGYSKSLSALDAVFGAHEHWVTLSVFGDAQLRISLTDGYWIYYLFGGPKYEPELEWLLPRLLRRDEHFIDCGANIGYWSVFVSRLVSPDQILAVEAADAPYRWLEANSVINGGFRTLQRAVWSQSGKALVVDETGEHPASRVSSAGRGPAVQSISLDDLVAGLPPSVPVILKLDVEGSELPAFIGAERTLSRPSVFIYEDHGADKASALTRALMTDLRLKVFYLDPAGAIAPISSIDSVTALKVDSSRGYNFATAVPGSWGASRLNEVAAETRPPEIST